MHDSSATRESEKELTQENRMKVRTANARKHLPKPENFPLNFAHWELKNFCFRKTSE